MPRTISGQRAVRAQNETTRRVNKETQIEGMRHSCATRACVYLTKEEAAMLSDTRVARLRAWEHIRTQFLPREMEIGGQRAALRDRRVECAALTTRVGECDLGLGCANWAG